MYKVRVNQSTTRRAVLEAKGSSKRGSRDSRKRFTAVSRRTDLIASKISACISAQLLALPM